MKELGERLSLLRKSNGVSISEASNDLMISETELTCLENGNFKVFKDVYELKKIMRNYAKYLGLDENEVIDEFNDFLFEKTSKISKSDIENAMKNEDDKEEKVSSPYTKMGKTRYDFAPIVLLIVVLVFISLVVYLLLAYLKKDDNVKRELRRESVIVELT